MSKVRYFVTGGLWPLVTAKGRKRLPSMMREIAALHDFYKVFPHQYFSLGLYLRQIEGEVTEYMPKKIVFAWQRRINGHRRPPEVEDKVLFRRIMNDHGVPCVDELFMLEPTGRFVGSDGVPIDAAEVSRRIDAAGGRAFLKPVDGRGGEGARIFDAAAEPLSEAVDLRRNILVQPVLSQHSALVALYPHSVNTVRIDTLLTKDGSCVNNVAVLRIGAGGGVTDNASRGGLVVPIDLATGTLRAVGRRKPHYDTRFHMRHPDTGVLFAGFHLPFWSKVLDLVEAGARALAPLRSLGWDIAITPEGPVVIETNAAWNTDAFQLGGGLRDTLIGRMAMETWHNDPEARIVP
jgi:hypothetical protein